jgi:hypothetical protein
VLLVIVGSIAGLYERKHELHAYCHHCDRWRVLDLEAMVLGGMGSRRLPVTVRCLRCGEVGTLQVRPPMPPPSRSGWSHAADYSVIITKTVSCSRHKKTQRGAGASATQLCRGSGTQVRRAVRRHSIDYLSSRTVQIVCPTISGADQKDDLFRVVPANRGHVHKALIVSRGGTIEVEGFCVNALRPPVTALRIADKPARSSDSS